MFPKNSILRFWPRHASNKLGEKLVRAHVVSRSIHGCGHQTALSGVGRVVVLQGRQGASEMSPQKRKPR